MKTTCQLALLTLFATVLLCVPAAAQYYWGPGGSLGGTGTWTATSQNWGTSEAGPFNVSSSGNSNNNVLAGDFGTVTVDGTVLLRSLRFTTDGYVIEGGDDNPTLRRGSGGGILLAANVADITATISDLTLSVGTQTVPINVGFQTGDLENRGTMVLENVDFVSQNVIIRSGTALMGGTNSFSGSEIEVWDGATLAVASDTALGNSEVKNDGILTFNRSDTLVIPNAISGSGTLTQAGSGTVVLTGDTSYEGTTTVENGTLLVNGTHVGGGTYTVERGATLAVASDTALGAGTMVFTAGRLRSADTEQRMISNEVRFAQGDGTASIYLGSTDAAHSGTLVFTGDGTLQGGGRGLWVDSLTKFEGNIGESGAGYDLVKRGPGTLVLAGENSYTGRTRIEAGVLQLSGGHDRLSAATDIVLSNVAGAAFDLGGYDQQVRSLAGGGGSGGNVVNSGSATSVLTIAPPSGQHTYHGRIEGDIRVEVVGSQDLAIAHRQRLTNSNNTYTGGTLMDGFALSVNVDGSLGAVPGLFDAQNIVIRSGGVLMNNDSFLTLHENRGITLGAGGGGLVAGWAKDVRINGRISGDAGNDLTVLSARGTVILAGDNTYAGRTILSAPDSPGHEGRLQVGAGGTTGTLGAGDVTNDGILTFNRADTLVVPNAISGSGTLTQAGGGTVVLTGDNSYTGATTVENGTLLVNGTHAGGGTYTVDDGATLGGNGVISGAATILGGAIVSPGDGVGMLTFENTLTLEAGAGIRWEFDGKETAGVDYDLLRGLGDDAALYLPDPQSDPITLSIFGPGATLMPGDSFTVFDGDVFDYNDILLGVGDDLSGLFTIDDQSDWWGTWEVTAGSLMLTAVPEPGTWLLLLLALAGGLLVRRRR